VANNHGLGAKDPLNDRSPDNNPTSRTTKAQYRSVSAVCPSEEEKTAPTESLSAFEHSLDLLSKPIKKNTYQPLTQERVQFFYAETGWKNSDWVTPAEARWNRKEIPLAAVREQRYHAETDGFLECLQPPQYAQNNDVRSMVGSRSRLNRYPGNEVVFEPRPEEYTEDEYASQFYVKVKRINTQSSNHPIWYFYQHRQILYKVTENPSTAKVCSVESS
jgi:hypothetical protein